MSTKIYLTVKRVIIYNILYILLSCSYHRARSSLHVYFFLCSSVNSLSRSNIFEGSSTLGTYNNLFIGNCPLKKLSKLIFQQFSGDWIVKSCGLPHNFGLCTIRHKYQSPKLSATRYLHCLLKIHSRWFSCVEILVKAFESGIFLSYQLCDGDGWCFRTSKMIKNGLRPLRRLLE